MLDNKLSSSIWKVKGPKPGICFDSPLPVTCLQATPLLLLLLLPWGGMSALPPGGLLGRVFCYIDRHQDELVQVGGATHGEAGRGRLSGST